MNLWRDSPAGSIRTTGVLVAALLVAALALSGCSSAPTTPSSAVPPTTNGASGGTGGGGTGQAFHRVGPCEYSGAIPSPRVSLDGAPEVQTQLGIALAPAAASPLLAAAYRQFNDMRCTRYQHRDVQNAAEGTYYYDCVGFTSYTLRVAAPRSWDELVAGVHLRSGLVPSPKRYVSFFRRLESNPRPGWRQVATAAAILPGDLLAWSPSAEDTASDGHSVEALSKPLALGDGHYALVVMDSTATPHGPDDTRQASNRLSERNAPLAGHGASTTGRGARSGLGIGTIVLFTRSSGKVVGVEWSFAGNVEHVSFAAARAVAPS